MTVTWRAGRWGVLAAGILAVFYVGVLGAASGFSHVVDQARQDWWLLGPIVLGFAIHVALVAELRQRHRAQHLAATTGAGAGASTVGMVACCAHHLADLVPLVGATGAAAVLFDWRVPLMLSGLVINTFGIGIAARRLRSFPAVSESTGRRSEVDTCVAA